jgi:hypothetical protein
MTFISSNFSFIKSKNSQSNEIKQQRTSLLGTQ